MPRGSLNTDGVGSYQLDCRGGEKKIISCCEKEYVGNFMFNAKSKKSSVGKSPDSGS